MDQESDSEEPHMHVSNDLAQAIRALKEESSQLGPQAVNVTRRCQEIEAHFTALQRENQRLKSANALTETCLRREHEKTEFLLQRCADQEGMLSYFRKDFSRLQCWMGDLRDTWEDIGSAGGQK